MKLLLLAVCVGVVVCVQDIRPMCLTCCGASPCCNYCGMDPDLFKPLSAVRRDVTNSLLGKGGVTFCPECCGPPPCCSTCGIDFSKLKDFLGTAQEHQ